MRLLAREFPDPYNGPARCGIFSVTRRGAKNLEQMAKPSADRVVKACEKVLYRNGRG